MKKLFALMIAAFLVMVGSVVADKLLSASGIADSNSTLVAAPGAGNVLSIYLIHLQNQADNATTVRLTDGAGSAIGIGKLYTTGSSLDISSDEPFRLPPNSALLFKRVGGINTHSYTIWYKVDRMR